MKKIIGVCALAVAALVNQRAAHADPLWVYAGFSNGHTPVHLSVSSFNNPMVSTADGRIFKGAPGCAPGPICAPVTNWTDTGAANATNISQTLNGLGITQTTSNRLYFYGYSWPGASPRIWYAQPQMTAPNGSAACVGAVAAAPFQITYLTWIVAGYAPTFWATDCASTSLWQLNANMYTYYSNGVQTSYGSTRWNELDTGGGNHGLALFTSVSGGAIYQAPWFLSRYNLAYAWNPAGNRGVEAGAPKVKRTAITFMTDHYVIASGNVYFWNGDIHGHGVGSGQTAADWTFIAGPPPGATLKEIAWAPPYPAGAIPGVAQNAAPGSALWALDTQGNVYYLIDAPVVVVK